MILQPVPRPRDRSIGDEQVFLEEIERIVIAEGAQRLSAENVQQVMSNELNIDLPIESDRYTKGTELRIESTDSVADRDSPEAYRLGVDENGILLEASSPAGCFYAAQTLAGLASLDDEKLVVPSGEIRDWPAYEWRGFMLDPARGHIPVERVKSIIDKLARAKCNVLQLHLADNEGWRLELEAYPELAGGRDTDDDAFYSKADIRDILAYATERHITVIPEIDVPGHGRLLLERFPDLRCDVSPERSFGNKSAICIGRSETDEFLEDVFTEVAELFPADVVHIGGDEWLHNGIVWPDCSHCQQHMEVTGLGGVFELFYDFLRRLDDVLDGYDKRLMVWNDQIDPTHDPDLPEDMLVHFWRVDPRLVQPGGWGEPTGENSMQAFLADGYDVVNSLNEYTYINGSGDRLVEWAPHDKPEVPPHLREHLLGGEMAAWNGYRSAELRSYYRRALPSAIPLVADRLWNSTRIDDAESFSRALTRHVLGPATPYGFDLFEAFGGMALPANNPKDGNKARSRTLVADRSYDDALQKVTEMSETFDCVTESIYPPTDDVTTAYEDTLTWLVTALEAERRGIPRKLSMGEWRNWEGP